MIHHEGGTICPQNHLDSRLVEDDELTLLHDKSWKHDREMMVVKREREIISKSVEVGHKLVVTNKE